METSGMIRSDDGLLYLRDFRKLAFSEPPEIILK
jgi:hypothetical protein